MLQTTVDSLKINYMDKGSGELVVLLHGWGSNIELFENMSELLARKYHVVAPDMPGFGLSDEPKEPWRVDDYVDFVLKFLEPFAPKKVTFLGHSFGGRVIIKMASRDLPFEIEKVILVDSAGVRPKKTAAMRWHGCWQRYRVPVGRAFNPVLDFRHFSARSCDIVGGFVRSPLQTG